MPRPADPPLPVGRILFPNITSGAVFHRPYSFLIPSSTSSAFYPAPQTEQNGGLANRHFARGEAGLREPPFPRRVAFLFFE